MVIGNLDGRLAAAARIAMARGTAVHHGNGIKAALGMLRSGAAADLVVADVAMDIRSLATWLGAAGLDVPIIACGASIDAGMAAAAVHAGAREYIPLPPQPEMIAAILTAVADDGHARALPADPPPHAVVCRGGAGEGRVTTGDAHTTPAAEAAARSLVGRTVADVERDLILETLKRCLGNRTHAAGILGISVRTLRNKLAGYAAEGIAVPPPNNGEIRGAA